MADDLRKSTARQARTQGMSVARCFILTLVQVQQGGTYIPVMMERVRKIMKTKAIKVSRRGKECGKI
jgi:hypothetical protein